LHFNPKEEDGGKQIMGYYYSTSEHLPISLITWDWKEQPNWDYVLKAIDKAQSFNAGVKIFEIETNSDEYAIIIGTSNVSKSEADRYYRNQDDFFNWEE
jgi:hypothetical protein